MATSAQIAANTKNAQRATGPRTEAGKTAVRQNATRHGLTSKAILVRGESEEEYNALAESFLRDLKPANDTERSLTVLVAQNYWRLQRLYRTEAEFFYHAEGQFDSVAEMFLSHGGSQRAALFLRYLNSAERAYNRSLTDLRQMQAERRKAEGAIISTSASATNLSSNSQIGFVSQDVHRASTSTSPEVFTIHSTGQLAPSGV